MPVAKADTIVAINKDEQEYVKKIYKRDSHLIYWASPKSDSMSHQTKPAGTIPDEYLFFIGKIKKRKGWDTVLEALAELKRKGLNKKLIFVSPDDTAVAKNYATTLGVVNDVFFHSYVSNAEKNWLYTHATYVLAPSRYEGFGLPVFEAFIAGKPLLATDIAVYVEFLQHKKNAMMSKTGDGLNLAQNIIELDNNPQLAKIIVHAGKITASQFTEEIMINKFLELISN